MPSKKLQQRVKDIRPSIVRVLVTNNKNETYVGTGFFIRKNTILTCAHTLLDTSDLFLLREELTSKDKSQSIEELFKKHYKKQIKQVEIELENRQIIEAKTVYFDPENDVGLITINNIKHGPLVPISFDKKDIQLGKEVYLVGFPHTTQTANTEWPYTVTTGIISSHVHLHSGGYGVRDMLQVSLINLPGSSGSPLLSLDSGEAIGFLSGHMTWGRDGLASANNQSESPISFYLPLGIGYVNSFQMLKEIRAFPKMK